LAVKQKSPIVDTARRLWYRPASCGWSSLLHLVDLFRHRRLGVGVVVPGLRWRGIRLGL